MPVRCAFPLTSTLEFCCLLFLQLVGDSLAYYVLLNSLPPLKWNIPGAPEEKKEKKEKSEKKAEKAEKAAKAAEPEVVATEAVVEQVSTFAVLF